MTGSAFDKENPQHSLHVADWAWAQAVGKRSFFRSCNDAADIVTKQPDRYNRDDLNTRCNWDLP